MRICGIYKITNTTNNKVYIGQSTDIIARKRRHFNALARGAHDNPHLQESYNKHGEICFEFTIICGCCECDLDILEQKIIHAYNSTDRNYGYNCETGGHTGKHLQESTKAKIGACHKGIPLTAEHKHKLSEAKKDKIGELNNFYGHHHTEFAKALISQKKKGKMSGAKHPFFGKHHTEEAKEKNRMAHIGVCLGGESPCAKRVINLDTGKVFDSVADAERETGIFNPNIIKVCKGNRKTAGGYRWAYFKGGE